MSAAPPGAPGLRGADLAASGGARGLGRLWPWVPALLLGGLIGSQFIVLSQVLDDPTFATESDYYRKAVDWDARRAQLRESQALGWTARLRVEPAAGAGARPLTLALAGPEGAPLSGATVTAVAFANARAARPLELLLGEGAPGLYRGELRGALQSGLWELRLTATRGADIYEETLRFELAAPAAVR